MIPLRAIVKNLLLKISATVKADSHSKILYYHDLHASTPYTPMGTSIDLFKEHIRQIKASGFELVETITKPEGQVMICFDDGFRGIYDTKDTFVNFGIRPTVFLAVSLIGMPGYLNEAEIKELQTLGFRFQCHSWSHDDLTKYTSEELRHELGDSKRALESLLGQPVEEICFPIGYFSTMVVEECRKYGYEKMYSSIPGGYYDTLGFDGLIPRNLVQHSTPWQVKNILLGGNNLIANRYKKMHFRG